MRVYATAADAFPNAVPANADQLLRTASRIVDMLLKGRVYDVDANLMPTDPDVVQAMKDATCAIATELDATGALGAGSTVQWDQVKIGSVSLGGRVATSSAPTVAGVTVPAAALIALADVGTFTYYVGARPYSRPLDRVAT